MAAGELCFLDLIMRRHNPLLDSRFTQRAAAMELAAPSGLLHNRRSWYWLFNVAAHLRCSKSASRRSDHGPGSVTSIYLPDQCQHSN